jgi:hypothetical protein
VDFGGRYWTIFLMILSVGVRHFRPASNAVVVKMVVSESAHAR